MAEFCLDCWNRLNGTHYTPEEVSLEMDLCEGCGQWKPVVAAIGRRGPAGWLERGFRRLEHWVWSRRG